MANPNPKKGSAAFQLKTSPHPPMTTIRMITIGLFAITLVLFIISLFTSGSFPECNRDADCYVPFGCALHRCNCTYADFTPADFPGYRPYKCDPAGLEFHVDPVWLTTQVMFLLSLMVWVLIDLDLLHYLSLEKALYNLNDRLLKLENDD